MKVLVCGSRDIDDRNVIYSAIRESPFDADTIICSNESGVGLIASKYAALNPDIDVESHPIPEWVWEQIGSKSGPLRNGYMVEQADAVIAVRGGESHRSKYTIAQAEADGLSVYKVMCEQYEDRGWVIEREQLIEDYQADLHEFC